MKKEKKIFNGKEIYLLGKAKNGLKYYLVEPSWDCGWYWGFGYVQAYKKSDIEEHRYFDSLLLNSNKNAYDLFKDVFEETPLSDDELWLLCDYMKTFYTLRNMSELVYMGYSHYTSKAKIKVMKNDSIYKKINEVMMPELFVKIKSILSE